MNIKKTNTFKKSLLTLAVAGAMSTPLIVSANSETVEEVETITVTATRSPMSIENSLATQVVITRDDIARIQPKSVLDILSTVAGIDISTSGGRGQTASVYMRGANSDHTLFLLNGVRISSASLGSTNVQSIAPELIERIEIVKGPRAAIWGSDAIGGVIQIFTRTVNGGEHFVSTSVGSEGYRMLNGGIGVEHGDGFTSISAEHEESEGFDAKDDSEVDNDGYSLDSLSINGQQKVNDALSLNWLAQVNQGDTEYDSSRANESEIHNHVWQLGANYNWQANNISNTTQFNVSQNRTSSTSYGNGTSVDEGTLYDSRRNQFSLLNSSELSSQWELNLGADLYQEQLKGDAKYNNTERDTTAVFAHTMINDDDFSYELAARFDDVEGVDSETTYNASVGYQLLDSTHIAISSGTGFKAPTFNDLYYPL
ncbi:MAG: TonB-dependent receptor, partial [Alteromonadales bacterium]|nr:TonB-dependent receptor [Alteromonadales bacterium]